MCTRSRCRLVNVLQQNIRPGPLQRTRKQPLLNNVGCFSSSPLDLIKDLRTRSGAPITECKKALQCSNNDIEAAMDWLREHGAAKASKKVLGRITNEGLVGIKVSDNKKSATIVRIASETDFAGRSSKFVNFVMDVTNAALAVDASGKISDTLLLQAPCTNGTVKGVLDEVIVAIRENISIVDAIKITSEKGILVGYVHNKIDSHDAGMCAAIVEVSTINERKVPHETLYAVGKKLAMHVVAAMPQYMRPTDVPESEIQRERDLLSKQISDSSKSPEMMQKIVHGKLRKFYESVCLTEQQHMIEDKNPKVGTFLSSQGIAVTNFIVLSIG